MSFWLYQRTIDTHQVPPWREGSQPFHPPLGHPLPGPASYSPYAPNFVWRERNVIPLFNNPWGTAPLELVYEVDPSSTLGILSQGFLREVIRADSIQPISIDPDELGGPPYAIGDVYRDAYAPHLMVSSCPDAWPNEPCVGTGPSSSRWVTPIMRVTGYHDSMIDFRVRGFVPYKQWFVGGGFHVIFQFAFAGFNAQSHAFYTCKINIGQELWQYDLGYQMCQRQQVDFHVWLRVPSCDIVLAMYNLCVGDLIWAGLPYGKHDGSRGPMLLLSDFRFNPTWPFDPDPPADPVYCAYANTP